MLAKLKEEQDAQKREQGIYDMKGQDRRGTVAPEILRKPEDVRDDPRFSGDTEVIIKFVPLKCIDEKTLVDALTIREWIIFAIVEEDPYAQHYFHDIQRLHEKIEDIDKNLKRIPKLEFRDEQGKPLPEEKARSEREALFSRYSEERAQAENELEDTNRELKEHLAWRKKMKVDLKQGDVDRVTDTCSWHVKIAGTTDAQQIEDLLMVKENWPGIKLAAGSTTGEIFPPWAGRGDVPDGSNVTLPDYTSKQVNMIGARIKRVPTGVGSLQQLDRKTSSLSSEEFGIYYGEFHNGLKSGYGIDISDTGVYVGSFEEGFRRGRGRLDLADGTTIIGSFNATKTNKMEETVMFSNPYLEGEGTGIVEVYFADGGYYRGHMINGLIDMGTGDYHSAMNEIQSGYFKEGLLDGTSCYIKGVNEEEYLGHVHMGEKHGAGTYIDSYGDTFEGYYEHGLRHGRGTMKYNKAGCFRGYFVHDVKHGKASLEYGTKKKKKKVTIVEEQKKKEGEKDDSGAPKAPKRHENYEMSPFANIFQGFFVANGIANQGTVMDTVKQLPCIISRSNKRALYSLTQVLLRELRIAKKFHRNTERLKDIESFLRVDITKKKRKIYRQQKHFTKKMMYEDDVFGKFNFREMKNKWRLREERLKTATDDRHLFKKALVPRLKILDRKNMEIYTKAFERLEAINEENNTDVSEGVGGFVSKSFKRAKKKEELMDPSKSLPGGPGGESAKDGDMSEHSEDASQSTKSGRYAAMLSLPAEGQGGGGRSNYSFKAKSGNDDPNAVNYINKKLIKVALSDFEEVRERQRFLKYDLIWQRAEDAYRTTKKNAIT